jgi:cysteinyl-tRNA synthetase
MSKSLGNFFTVRDLLDQGIPGEVIRFVFLSTHYGKPMDWTERKAEEAEKTLWKWAIAVEENRMSISTDWPPSEAVVEALADDLNTPRAFSEMHALYESWRRRRDPNALFLLSTSADFLGLNLQKYYFEQSKNHPASVQVQRRGNILLENEADYELIEQLLARRSEAKAKKDWSKADQIRDGLQRAGVTVKDGPDGTEWEVQQDFDPAKLETLR